MQYTCLGNTGRIVSRLAFGVMTFGHDQGQMGSVWKTAQEDANPLVERSLDAGINFFDTAHGYAGGQSEVMRGKALGARRKDGRRKDPAGGKGRIVNFDILLTDEEKGHDLMERLRDVAGAHQAIVAQVAPAWLLSKPYVSTILLGASKLAQLEDNLGGAAKVRLSPEEVGELDQLTAPTPLYQKWFQNSVATDAAVRDALRASGK